MFKSALLVYVYIFVSTFAFSADVEISKFEHWFLIKNKETKLCYIFSYSINSISNIKDDKRKPYTMLVKDGKAFDWMYYGDYIFKAGSSTSFQCKKNGKLFRFEPNERHSQFAFLSDSIGAAEISKEVLNGQYIYMLSEFIDYKYALDTFSINGFDKAFKKMQESC